MALAVAAVAVSSLPQAATPTVSVLAIYAATNLVLALERPSVFLRHVPMGMLFIFDIASVTTLMFLAGERGSHFYVLFFLVILLAALAKSARFAGWVSVVSSIAYGLVVGVENIAQLVDVSFTTRVALLFVTALFAGYLAEEVDAERESATRSAQEASWQREATKRIEVFYRTLFEESTDGVLVRGPDGIIREANARAKEIFGGDPTGKLSRDFLNISDTSVGRLRPDGGGNSTAGASFPILSVHVVRSDGTPVSCEVGVKPFTVSGEDYLLYLVRDVGELRRMQKRLEELEHVGMLGEFVASLTHEINNPLSIVLGYAEMLKEGQLASSELASCAGYLLEAAQRCKRVIDAFLDQYRVRPFAPKPTPMAGVVRSTVDLMGFHLRYHLTKLTLEIDGEPTVLADARQIEQLLINLICNAVRAMEGRPSRRLLLCLNMAGDHVILRLSDTGCGIASEELGQIFRRGFSRGPDGSGHGIGLALCQEIVRRHGGQIEVDSHVGEGSTFTVRLPALTPQPCA